MSSLGEYTSCVYLNIMEFKIEKYGISLAVNSSKGNSLVIMREHSAAWVSTHPR